MNSQICKRGKQKYMNKKINIKTKDWGQEQAYKFYGCLMYLTKN